MRMKERSRLRALQEVASPAGPGTLPSTTLVHSVAQAAHRPPCSLLCLGTVGIVHHHATSEASLCGLGCDQLQLRGKGRRVGQERLKEKPRPHPKKPGCCPETEGLSQWTHPVSSAAPKAVQTHTPPLGESENSDSPGSHLPVQEPTSPPNLNEWPPAGSLSLEELGHSPLFPSQC